jgi:hypothetical protein
MRHNTCIVSDRKAGVLLGALSVAAAVTQLSAGETVKHLSVDDPRPVAEAVLTLESLYGWAITYEDPRYAHPGEVSDITEKVRRDLRDFPMGKAPRVVIPRGGPLTVDYPVNADSGTPENPSAVIQRVLDIHAAGAGSSFRLLHSGRYFHVVPAQLKNRNGNVEEQHSILDAVISVPSQQGARREMLEEVCHAIEVATQSHVVVGTIPERLFGQAISALAVFNQSARDVLTETLAGTGVVLSWRLLYDPGLEEYVLNIHPVPER